MLRQHSAMHCCKVLIECGHQGAGNSKEVVRYCEAADTIELFERLQKHPDLMSEGGLTHISLVKPISRQEFEAGTVVEWKRAT